MKTAKNHRLATFLYEKIDISRQMEYNTSMKNAIIYNTIIIGGGASGLFLTNLLLQKGANPNTLLVLERGERVGKKLSATGNGQGNITNLSVTKGGYFSSQAQATPRAQTLINAHDDNQLKNFFASLGVPLLPDERGRVYPASRQASALTDALRFGAEKVRTEFRTQVTKVEKQGGMFEVIAQTEEGAKTFYAKSVVLCTGGKAAKNFGTDGSAYALATAFGHTVTKLYPSLVQLKTETAPTKTLKGIRVNDGVLTARYPGGECSLQGDIIFTDYGVSGDAVFRISAYIADKIESGVTLSIDFLPQLSQAEVLDLLQCKTQAYPCLDKNETLFGIVNNQIGRAIFRRAAGDIQKAASFVKAFPLQVTGSLGFDYAQVTKGGVPLAEVDDNLQSNYTSGLYFAGEILDIDGACGGYNLQWAFSSACVVANAILSK